MSENTEDFKELINEKFKSVHTIIELQFSSIKNTLESIDNQVKKTNGRVLKLEENVYTLQLNDATHSMNCPHSKRMKDIEDEIASFKQKMSTDLEEYNFFKKYPKLSIGIITVMVLITLAGAMEIRSKLDSSSNKAKQPVEVQK